MPAKSKAQQRLFGMVDAYKKGKMKHASKKIKDIADEMSSDEVKKFAKTKTSKLPEKVEENVIRINESQLRQIIKESVHNILTEGYSTVYTLEDEASGEVIECYSDASDLEEAIDDANKLASKYKEGRFLVKDNDDKIVYDTNPGVSFKF